MEQSTRIKRLEVLEMQQDLVSIQLRTLLPLAMPVQLQQMIII